MMTHRTLSSSSFTGLSTYSVFLSFRGIDTRTGFTGHLYDRLCGKGIKTFKDDEELQKGKEITPALVQAIHQSRIAIVIFSKNYASSTFCLEELVKVLELMEQNDGSVLPVFYQVDPSDVKYQKGSFGEAFDNLINKRFKNDTEKVQKWISTLKVAANLSGWHIKDGDEYKYVNQIVDEVSKSIPRIPLHVANYPVGLESRVKEVNALLETEPNEGVNMVGIYGIGGIGKTTLVCAVYNLIANDFEGVCFLKGIKEISITDHDLAQLQKKLLVDILGEKDIKFGNVNEGITIIKHRLQKTKVLLILDDVDKPEQLQALAGGLDWFGFGSRIIITTRDKHLLVAHCVESKYEVKVLNQEDAFELLSWNAFKRKKVEPSYMVLANYAVSYCKGLPLALEVMGSNLCERRIGEWESAIQEYQRIPIKSIYRVLKVSYDCLEEYQQKIFLDLACCFQGAKLEFVTNTLLHGRDLDPRCGIEELVDKSLVKIDGWNCVRMHDLIRDMGREIVRQESLSRPENCSRLWYSEDIIHILEEDKGTNSIEVMLLNLPRNRKVQWDGEAFKKMKNLQVLIIRTAEFSTEIKHLPSSLRFFEWDGYPFSTLSSKICPRNLVSLNVTILNLPNSNFKFDRPLEKFQLLTRLNLSDNTVLIQVPDVTGIPNLEELWLKGCLNLTKIHNSVGIHSKIRVLDAEGCTKLRTFPRYIVMKSLEFLNLSHCSSLKIFPEIGRKMENLIDIKLDYSGIENLPFSIQNLVGLQHIWLQGCSGLSRLPSSILNLTVPKLEDMNFRDYNNVKRSSVLKDTSSNIYQGPSWLEELVDFNLELKEPPRWFSKTVTLQDEEFFKAQDWKKDFFSRRLPHMSNWELSRLNSSNFTILPETTELQSTNENLRTVSCSWLSSESVSMLLSQVFHEIGLRNLLISGSSVPEWFHHRSKGPSLSFWYKNYFPPTAVCAILSPPRRTFVEFRDVVLIINGTLKITLDTRLLDRTLVTDHILMFDLEPLMEGHMVNRLTSKHGWNHVEISGITDRQDFVTWMGVYNYDSFNSEDISYARPNPPPRRTFDDLELQEDPTMKDHPALLESQDAKLPTMYYNEKTPIIWEAICNMQAPPTIKILLWEICKHDLPTYQSLFQKKIIDSPLCPICKKEDETLEHLFLLCSWSQHIWLESDFQRIVDFNSLECIEVWLWQRLQLIKREHPNFNQANALLGCICWAIWNGRNDFIFEDQPVKSTHAWKRAETMYKEYFGPSLVQQTKLHQFSVYYKIGGPSEQPALESQSEEEGHHSELDSGIYDSSQSLELALTSEHCSSNFKSALGRFFARCCAPNSSSPSEQPALESQSEEEGHHSELDSGIYDSSQSLELALTSENCSSHFKSALGRFFARCCAPNSS